MNTYTAVSGISSAVEPPGWAGAGVPRYRPRATEANGGQLGLIVPEEVKGSLATLEAKRDTLEASAPWSSFAAYRG